MVLAGGDIIITVQNTGGADITIGGTISSTGSFGFIKDGNGNLNLASGNTYEGNTVLEEGSITLIVNDALGTGGFEFAGGVLNANNRLASLGTLSLTADSTLNLISDSTAGNLTFDAGAYTAGTLTINGWSGVGGTGGDDDRIFITADPGSDFLNQIQFAGFDPGAIRLGTGEIVPVPEPTEWALIIFATLAGLYKFVLPRIRKSVIA